ncbi:MAG: hydroxymethylbilane synthase [Rhodospirillales bacterium]
MPRIRIGTRGSPLALWQANAVRDRLVAADPSLAEPGAVEIVPIRTSGDRIQGGPLTDLGGKGLFTKEIEEGLAAGALDLAVHSLKDMPTRLPDGLVVTAVLERADPRDALIATGATGLADIARGAAIGTAALRRKALVLHRRPDLRVVPLRGNVETRLRKIAAGEADATLLAVAGLARLGLLDRAAAILPADEVPPAVCQGIIAIECRAADSAIRTRLDAIDHRATAVAATAERAFLDAIDGSCRTPIAGLAEIDAGTVALRALVIRPDGTGLIEACRRGAAADAAALGADAGAELKGRAGPDYFA